MRGGGARFGDQYRQFRHVHIFAGGVGAGVDVDLVQRSGGLWWVLYLLPALRMRMKSR